MDEQRALSAFAALSQETRLRIVRLLVTAGGEGVSAGAIAQTIGASPSNVSFHLKELVQAGLASCRRQARSIVYFAQYDALADLVGFLMRDCCQGHPDVCAPAVTSLAACSRETIPRSVRDGARRAEPARRSGRTRRPTSHPTKAG